MPARPARPDPTHDDLRTEAAAMAQGALAVADAIRTRDSHWAIAWRAVTLLLLVVVLVVAYTGQRASRENGELLRFQREVLTPVLCQSYAQRGTPPPPALECPPT